MNALLDEALRQAYALAPATLVHYHTLEISHIGISEKVYLVKGFKHLEFGVPGDGTIPFKAAAFQFSLPPVNGEGLQELMLAFDNVDKSIAQFCRMARTYPAPIIIKYRPYISSDLSTPRYDPPLLMYLLNVQIKKTRVTGRAVPRDFINKQFPNRKYNTEDFQALIYA